MGSNDSKQGNEKKTDINNNQQKPVGLYSIHNSDSEYESESRLPKDLPREKHPHRHKKLHDPSNHRPLELSWLQQNNSNDNSNQTHHHHHGHHHRHHHHDHHEHHQPSPLAINRWPKENDQNEKQPKSFAEEYIHRK